MNILASNNCIVCGVTIAHDQELCQECAMQAAIERVEAHLDDDIFLLDDDMLDGQ